MQAISNKITNNTFKIRFLFIVIKERIFCIIAYLPKATVQSAKAGIPLQMGVVGGEVMQAIAILSVLITAPIGAIGINLTSPKLLKQNDEYEELVV